MPINLQVDPRLIMQSNWKNPDYGRPTVKTVQLKQKTHRFQGGAKRQQLCLSQYQQQLAGLFSFNFPYNFPQNY